jgi:enoyl-CoA hydratase/carnithine racemase
VPAADPDSPEPDSPTGLRRRPDGHVLWLTIDRPQVRNALDREVIDALAAALRTAGEDPTLRAVVVTAAGDRVFCAGADLKPGSGVFASDFSQPRGAYADLLRAAADSPLPIVGRVNGHALAGGMGLVAMCDMVVAAEHARFGFPEVKVGMFPMVAGAACRPLLPDRLFKELCFTGEPISAHEALSAGLVNYVVPAAELDAKVAWLLERVTTKSPTGIRRGRHALRTTQDMSFDEALAYMEAQLSTLALTEDAAEGLRAFNEKRPPRWTGR